MAERDPHEVLGVSPTASDNEIRSAYKRQALRWHPDRNPDNVDEANRRFIEIGNAYASLTDDQPIEHAPNEAFTVSTGHPSKMAEFIFGRVFGKQFRQQNFTVVLLPPPDTVHTLSVTLEQLATSQRRCLKVTRKNAQTNTQETSILNVQLSPALQSQDKLRFPCVGDVNENNVAGDVVVVIDCAFHELYTRLPNNNLECYLSISCYEALAGFSRELTSVRGKTIKINFPYLPSARPVIIAGQGMSADSSMLVYIDMRPPTKALSKQERQILHDILV